MPADAVIYDVVGSRGIADIIAVVLGKGIGLSDVGIIIRFARSGIVVFFRRHIPRLSGNRFAEFHSAAPDAIQFVLI